MPPSAVVDSPFQLVHLLDQTTSFRAGPRSVQRSGDLDESLADGSEPRALVEPRRPLSFLVIPELEIRSVDVLGVNSQADGHGFTTATRRACTSLTSLTRSWRSLGTNEQRSRP